MTEARDVHSLAGSILNSDGRPAPIAVARMALALLGERDRLKADLDLIEIRRDAVKRGGKQMAVMVFVKQESEEA